MTANDLAAKVQHLAPASHTALRLVTMLDRSSINNDDVVKVLKCDNILTAKLLRACNSTYYGFDEPVASVEQAVLILGHRQILRIIFAITFNSVMAVPMPGYAAEANELWRHSLVTALNCEALAKNGFSVGAEPSVAFTGGLLHDIGKLALNEVLNEECQTAIRSRIHENGRSSVEAEQEVIGTDHAQVGACMLKTWKLPEEIIEAVGNHHHPASKPQARLSALVHTADCLTHLLGSTFGWEALAVRVDSGVTDALQLTPEKMEGYLVTAHDSLAQADYLEKLS